MTIKPKHIGITAIALSVATASTLSTAQLTTPGQTSPGARASAFAGPLQTERQFNRLIIKFKEKATTRAGAFNLNTARSQVALLEDNAALQVASTSVGGLTYLKSVTPQTHVATTGQKLSRAELFALAKHIEQDPNVAYAEVDELAYPSITTPTDPDYLGQQWHYQASATYAGGINLPTAWDTATGTGVVVAVIDTGVRSHVDLTANQLPGYDFISDTTVANDGNGRDADASDPGDWTTAGACYTGSLATNSTWHGTHVAGTIAAAANNGNGGVGVAYSAKILPVRALGVCGGYISDIAAGMQWAVGVSIPGVPNNPPANKAKVLNLSLGGRGICGQTYQDAVDAARTAGSVVVVATGNDGLNSVSRPANCSGVIAVTAHTKLGDNADYANIGAGTTISGPGGGTGSTIAGDGSLVYSTMNSGTTVPVADSYVGYKGTSMATPHVAGVAALLFSKDSALTPDAVSSILISSARVHPVGTFCASRTDCGAGLLDANAALARITSGAPTVAASVVQTGVRLTGSTVNLTAATSGGTAPISYVWTKVVGGAVTLTNSTTATPSFVAPTPGGSYTFKVTATDSAATPLTASNYVSVITNTAPVLTSIPAQSVVAGANLSFTATATDADSNAVTFVASGLPSGASLNATTGVFTWNAAGPVGSYTFTVKPNDGYVDGASQTVSVTVTAPPAPASGGGGGAMDGLDVLALLSLAGLGLFGRRQRSVRD
ncbi:MAG: S8 family serine peptidase [Rhodoferax sp.]